MFSADVSPTAGLNVAIWWGQVKYTRQGDWSFVEVLVHFAAVRKLYVERILGRPNQFLQNYRTIRQVLITSGFRWKFE